MAAFCRLAACEHLRMREEGERGYADRSEPMTCWIHQSAPPALMPGDVHLWRADLGGSNEGLSRQREMLSPEELRRADRFVSASDRRRYIRGRAKLRELLGGYLSQDPASVPLRRGAHGKPALEGATSLQFNLSHSGEAAVFAFGRMELGVDIERIRPDVD